MYEKMINGIAKTPKNNNKTTEYTKKLSCTLLFAQLISFIFKENNFISAFNKYALSIVIPNKTYGL